MLGILMVTVLVIGPGDNIQAAVDRLAVGDTLKLRAGTYVQRFEVHADGVTITSDSATAPLVESPADAPGLDVDTIRVYSSSVVLSHLRVSNLNDTGQGIWVADVASYAGIHDCEVFGTHGQGILVSGDHTVVSNNNIHDNGSHTPFDHGVYIEGSNDTVVGNHVHHNWCSGIQIFNGYPGMSKSGNTVSTNLVENNGRCAVSTMYSVGGIVIGGNSADTYVDHNIVRRNSRVSLLLLDLQSATIRDNTFCDCK